MAGNIIPKLPRNPADGTEVCDRYGNRWQYTAESDAWISKGVISSYSIVTEENHGLIDQTIYTKLRNLEAYTASYDLTTLKILPGRDAYWYYFRSSDKLIKFKPEGESTLRIEVDKARLYQILAKNRKPGLRGEQGETGPDGQDGLPGESVCDPDGGEPCYRPSAVVGSCLDFAIFTPIPLTLDGPIELPNNHIPTIAVRLFKIQKQSATPQRLDPLRALRNMYISGFDTGESFNYTRNILVQRSMGVKQSVNLCNISLSEVISSPGTLAVYPSVTIDIDPADPSNINITATTGFNIDIEATKKTIVYDKSTNIVCGSVFLKEPEQWNIDEWCVKSRQRGPDGVPGEPGECRIKISECIVDDTNIEATCPIVNVRLDCDRDVLYTMCANLLNEICVSKVRLEGLSETLTHRSTLKSVFAAAQTILDECKYVYRYLLDLPDDEIPDLEFVHWDPQPGCVTQRHFDRHKFNWVPNTDIPSCDDRGTWYSPTEVRPGKYPWGIALPGTPPADECCQDDFFYCPNVQDAPCPGEPPPPPPPPPPPSPFRAASMRASDMHDIPVSAKTKNRSVALGTRRWNVKS